MKRENMDGTTDLETVRRQIDWQLKELKTDYIDYGFIHCLDAKSDWKDYQENGILEYLQEMKAAGVVKHIGLSSHTPALARLVLDTGIVDQLMFSINPAYDYQHGDYARGSASERMELYRRCEAEGIGISVMKPYSGGQLLNKDTSPFGQALTTCQCIQYALDKPGSTDRASGGTESGRCKGNTWFSGHAGKREGLFRDRNFYTQRCVRSMRVL